jgi:hypothetical protein
MHRGEQGGDWDTEKKIRAQNRTVVGATALLSVNAVLGLLAGICLVTVVHLSGNMPPVVYEVVGGLVSVLSQYVVCYGGGRAKCRQQCTGPPGTTCVLGPLQLSNGILFEPLDDLGGPPGVVRIAATALAEDPSDPSTASTVGYIGADGSVTWGPYVDGLQAGMMTFQGSPSSSTLIGMYATSTVWSLVDPGMSGPGANGINIYKGCHIYNASLCGHVLEFTETGRVLFSSADHLIQDYVDYGFISANTRAYFLLNGSSGGAEGAGEEGEFIFTSFQDNGVAMPILRNPLNMPPPSQGLWVDVFNSTSTGGAQGGGCAQYTGVPWTSKVLVGTCQNMSTLPWHLAVAAGQLPTTPSYGLVTIPEDTLNTPLQFTVYSDSNCTTGVASLSGVAALGCNAGVHLGGGMYVAFNWRLQVSA